MLKKRVNEHPIMHSEHGTLPGVSKFIQKPPFLK